MEQNIGSIFGQYVMATGAPELEPPFVADSLAWSSCRKCVSDLMKLQVIDEVAIERVRQTTFDGVSRLGSLQRPVRLACSFLCDLRKHGWAFKTRGKRITLIPFKAVSKQEIRDSHKRDRD